MTDDFAARLLAITNGCRIDMHEPDEQGIEAFVVGDHLDNAIGDGDTTASGFQELVVILKRDEVGTERFNLASLIALARRGARAEKMLAALTTLAKHVERARADEDVSAATSGGAWLVGDVMSEALEASFVAIASAEDL